LGITSSESIPVTFPNPSHFLHAPKGLLKEKKSKLGSSNRISSFIKRLLNFLIVGFLPLNEIILHFPFPS